MLKAVFCTVDERLSAVITTSGSSSTLVLSRAFDGPCVTVCACTEATGRNAIATRPIARIGPRNRRTKTCPVRPVAWTSG